MKHRFTLEKHSLENGRCNTVTITDHTNGPTILEYLKQGYSIISSTPVK